MDYDLNNGFLEGIENAEKIKNSSDVRINPFIAWRNLKFNNSVTIINESACGESKTTYAGVQLDVDWSIPFNFYLVHGLSNNNEEVCFIFTNRNVVDTFVKELKDPVVWELNEVFIKEMRENKRIPSVLTNQLPIE